MSKYDFVLMTKDRNQGFYKLVTAETCNYMQNKFVNLKRIARIEFLTAREKNEMPSDIINDN